MNQISPVIRLLTYQESQQSGIHIQSLVFDHNGNRYHLSGGTSDTIYVFTESIGIYVLTINKSLGYVGLNSYMAPEPDPINSVFLHNLQEVKVVLGPKWDSTNPATMVRKLINYLC